MTQKNNTWQPAASDRQQRIDYIRALIERSQDEKEREALRAELRQLLLTK